MRYENRVRDLPDAPAAEKIGEETEWEHFERLLRIENLITFLSILNHQAADKAQK